MRRISLIVSVAAAVLAAGSTVASAHVGVGDTAGFAYGFGHPLGGLDHILAMIAVGLYAAQLGGRAVWLVPASFVCFMIFGAALGVADVAVPFVEIGIGLSVVFLGAAVACGLRVGPAAAMAVVGFFAIFHGHAHGAEMPGTAAGLAYGVGFAMATALLHALGIAGGLMLGSRLPALGPALIRSLGAVASIAGIGLLAGVLG
jgi:urease accessory protein